jgi:hypothetical protein
MLLTKSPLSNYAQFRGTHYAEAIRTTTAGRDAFLYIPLMVTGFHLSGRSHDWPLLGKRCPPQSYSQSEKILANLCENRIGSWWSASQAIVNSGR